MNTTRYKGPFVVTTRSGRIVGYANAIEQAEDIQSNGRDRYIWRWDSRSNRYV